MASNEPSEDNPRFLPWFKTNTLANTNANVRLFANSIGNDLNYII